MTQVWIQLVERLLCKEKVVGQVPSPAPEKRDIIAISVLFKRGKINKGKILQKPVSRLNHLVFFASDYAYSL